MRNKRTIAILIAIAVVSTIFAATTTSTPVYSIVPASIGLDSGTNLYTIAETVSAVILGGDTFTAKKVGCNPHRKLCRLY